MSKAEEKAFELYPYSHARIATSFGSIAFDQNHDKREEFVKGYEQAQQDLMDEAKQNVNGRLNELRNFLISETERFQERAKSPNASPCGSHFDRGIADGFIKSRAKLEELFDLWDNL